MIIGHTNTVWLDGSLVRSVGHRRCPIIYSGLFLHCRGHLSSTHLKHGSHLCITSACPCILWTPLQPIPPASNLQREHACPHRLWKTQVWAAAWGKDCFYNTVPSMGSPFLFSSWVQNLSNVHVICSWTNSFLSLHCRNFNFLPFHIFGSKTFTKWYLELKLLSLDAIPLVNNSMLCWNIVW